MFCWTLRIGGPFIVVVAAAALPPLVCALLHIVQTGELIPVLVAFRLALVRDARLRARDDAQRLLPVVLGNRVGEAQPRQSSVSLEPVCQRPYVGASSWPFPEVTRMS